MNGFAPPVARRWHALDDGVMVAGLAALRTLWVWPLLQMGVLTLFPFQSYLFPLWMVFALLLGGSLAAQVGVFLLNGRAATLFAALTGLAAVGVVLYLALAPGPEPFWDVHGPAVILAHPGRTILVTLVAVWLWWWGMRAGLTPLGYDALAHNFTWGLVALLLLLVINAGTHLLAVSALLAALLGFLAIGLFLLALSSIQDARRYESARTGHGLPLARHWWATVGAIIGLLLLISLLLSRVFLPETLDRLATWIAAAVGLVWQVVATLILLVGYPIAMLIDWLLRLLNLRPLEAPPLQIAAPPGIAEQLDNFGNTNAHPAFEIPAVVWGVGILLIAALIVVVFLFALRRSRIDVDEDVAEDHESILSLDLLKAQLAQLWRNRNRAGAQQMPFVALSGDEPGVRVRRTYQALLAWAAARGLARAPGMTPEHYLRLLCDAFPGQGDHFLVITAAYGAVRYGAATPSEESANTVLAAWQQILAAAEQLTPA